MCKIFDWVFDSVSVEQAPQDHVEDPNQDEDEDEGSQDEIENPIFYIHVGRLNLPFFLLSLRRNNMVMVVFNLKKHREGLKLIGFVFKFKSNSI